MKLFSFFKKSPDILNRLAPYNLPEKDLGQWNEFMRTAQDREVFRVNPRYLAKQLDWTEQQILDMLTVSVAEELWNLEWNSFCPACGNLVQSATELRELHSHQSCEMCGAEADIQLDQEVVAYASIAENIRRLDSQQRDDAKFRQQVDERLGRVPSLHLINRPLFRQILGEQVLPPNQSLGVQNLAIFFSDLKQSTRLYQRLGDARAYGLVREHFDTVFNAVERHGGSAVKTIGDGVMGTFFDSASALRGETESITGLEKVNQREGLSDQDRLRLKVGLHTGACIVVTLNGRLDYFGSTVNIAARLSDIAQGGEVILSKAVLADPQAQELVENMQCDQEQETALRGVQQPIEVCRLRPSLT